MVSIIFGTYLEVHERNLFLLLFSTYIGKIVYICIYLLNS